MSLSLPRGSWLVTAPLMALAVAYFVFIFRPVRAEIARLKLDLQTVTDATAESQAKLARVHTMRQAVEQADRNLTEWRRGLPSATAVGAVYGRISHLADTARLTTTRFAPGAPSDLEFIRSVPLEMQCRGSFQDIWELLEGLEKLEDVVWVEKAEIEARQDKSGDLQLELILVVFAGRGEISG